MLRKGAKWQGLNELNGVSELNGFHEVKWVEGMKGARRRQVSSKKESRPVS